MNCHMCGNSIEPGTGVSSYCSCNFPYELSLVPIHKTCQDKQHAVNNQALREHNGQSGETAGEGSQSL